MTHLPPSPEDAGIRDALVIGAGFGGICVGVALRRAGVEDFLILEKGAEPGGVWRDNTYPGAACDVPSHLYSFSFAPNPGWSHTFARQGEIHAYLHDCVRRFELGKHLRYRTEVAAARYDEALALWEVSLASGERMRTRMLVSATGLLSRPLLPRLPGIDSFRGPAFHSAQWDHACSLSGKRVAVIGTGASATQFVPAIAGETAKLTVFQRSPAYVIARRDRAYRPWQQALFRRLPLAMRLHRGLIYVKYEARALAFTRMKAILSLAVGRPFRRMLARDVLNPDLRARLTPDYPIGCKRILLSDDYLSAFSRPEVALVTDPVRRITPGGIETEDGTRHEADVLIYGTGFAATEFLAPMRITGRGGRELNEAWREGAEAFLGMTVPGFPNFFMLYGPNTNLGHNSIVYMLESQVEHVMRCRREMIAAGAASVEVEPTAHRRFNTRLHARLADAVWQGCSSWYLDRHGRNSANWPGFTFSYRLLTRHASLRAYRFASPLDGRPDSVGIAAPRSPAERGAAAFQRAFLRTAFKPLIGPPFSAPAQRRYARLLAPLMPGVGGVGYRRIDVGGLAVEIVTPEQAGQGAVLYLHGGAFCLGSARTHRSITSRLARDAGLALWVPDYRLAPEHPYPAALEDGLACFDAMLAAGIPAARIVLAGDSAGAALALAVALRLRARGDTLPAALALVSPVTRIPPPGPDGYPIAAIDPMVRAEWVRQGVAWYACPPEAEAHHPLRCNLAGLPPMLVQAGDQEILLPDAQALVAHARACGVSCRFELHRERWHVFHLQAFYLRSAANAIGALAQFARAHVASANEHATA
ncbi:alpha/beta hydrolase fold domain-containing protein [Massilia sp. Mn16-1_5]|uniref:alpha/beta hydrolase fold domain-containing protein n=1 Tax=Massilia sp. Mn16-1_5 TaxID=2079199 RepID=UPI00109EC0F4|nr:alpha/beta hydrolase fold domain-containing protein [Massilia sp. Mn16-1_5]THC46791.1 alpha/beta hydrolase [Massilia sp. Mn16-1_5]